MTTPVWDDLLTANERRALEPGPDALDATPDVLVVGGGVVGLATAAFCRRAGIERVLLIERDRLAAGPSGRAAGTLTPGFHALLRDDPFVRLASRGLELHREIADEWETGLRTIDSLAAIPAGVLPPDALERAGARVVDGVTARDIEPEFGEVEEALHIPRQGSVRPLRFAAALAGRAGAVATGVEMRALEFSNGRVTRVRTSHGDVTPGAVVVCTGTSDLVAVPQHRIKGHMFATEPAPFRLRTLPAMLIGFVQTDEGRIVVGGTVDAGEDPALAEDVIELMAGQLRSVIPRAKTLAIEHRWTCFRPATPDETPVIDRIPGLDNAWASIGHFRTGIMVAPAAAELATEWIATGVRPDAAADFAADRF
jgi:glycine/D-amino acid oxidase-like deaminating enzyme